MCLSRSTYTGSIDLPSYTFSNARFTHKIRTGCILKRFSSTTRTELSSAQLEETPVRGDARPATGQAVEEGLTCRRRPPRGRRRRRLETVERRGRGAAAEAL